MVYSTFLNKQGAKLIFKKPLSLHLSKDLKICVDGYQLKYIYNYL